MNKTFQLLYCTKLFCFEGKFWEEIDRHVLIWPAVDCMHYVKLTF